MPDDVVVDEIEETATEQADREAREFAEEFDSEEPTEAAKGKTTDEPAKADSKVESDVESTDDAPPAKVDAPKAGTAEARLADLAKTITVDDDDEADEATTTIDADAIRAEVEAEAQAKIEAAEERAQQAEAALKKSVTEAGTISLDEIPTVEAFLDRMPSGDLKREFEEMAEDNPEQARFAIAVAASLGSKGDGSVIEAMRAELDELKTQSTDLKQANEQRRAQIAYANDLVNGFTDDKGVAWKGHADAVEKATSPEFQEWLGTRSKREQDMAAMSDPVYSHMLLDAFDESKYATEAHKQADLKRKRDALHGNSVHSSKSEGSAQEKAKTAEQEYSDGWDEEEEVLEKERAARRGMRVL